MDEQRLERRLRREVERRHGKARKLVTPGASGTQDRLVLLPPGRVWFIEMKAPGKKLRPLQVHRAHELQEMGFKVRTISTETELKAFLAEVDEGVMP